MWKPMLLTLFLLGVTVSVAAAQLDDCPAVVTSALKSASELCASLGRNTACYGANQVKSVTFSQPPPANFFQSPGDRSELVQFREINPQPLDQLTGQFGVALLNLQANLPNTLPGQGVIFLLMGNARLTNEVPQSTSQQTPFQGFYFLPGLERSKCYEAEPMLTIQTPGNISISLNFNGVQTEMSPSTLLTITSSVCTIHRGYITQRVGDKKSNLLTNQTVDIHIAEDGTINVDNLRGISEREYKRGLSVQTTLNTIAQANKWAEQYISPQDQFDVEPTRVSPTPITPNPSTPSQAQPQTCAALYTVQSGDSLKTIAQAYKMTEEAIAQANQLTSPTEIVRGQVLCIPGPR
jgi:LysM repeat protein